MDRLSDYDYVLPEELIAQSPLADRAASRLLHLDRATGAVHHRQFRAITSILREGDLLVMNDTRVSALRLIGQKPSGAQVEALLLTPVGVNEYEAMVRPGKRLRIGAEIEFEGLRATVVAESGEGLRTLRFSGHDNVPAQLERVGTVPLPPYIHEVLQDSERYQTVLAKHPGSAAAPTAGLHFTDQILSELKALGVGLATVTLHVGIDTFRPVAAEDLSQHRMHGERCVLSEETANQIAATQGRIIAVGTTSVRTLESFAEGSRRVKSGSISSELFIRPGFEFQIIDGMFTNFHLPKTTMLMMISALSSFDAIKNAYDEAIAGKYRFLSFGDAMLII